jgi:glutamate carboxypeptidase
MDIHALRDLAAPRYDAFVAELRQMVNVDWLLHTRWVNAIADLCEARMRARGWSVERRVHSTANPARRPRDRTLDGGGPNVLLVGHMDTVFDEDTVAERPFRIEGDLALGPGVSDMKGGLLTGFHAVDVLQDAGFGGFGRITYVCNPDEEIGSPMSGPVIRELAPVHDAAFVLEGARANGDIVSARKGITDYAIEVVGRAAHAGVEPEKGANAVLAAAKATIAMQALNGRWPGVTVNVGVARGGTRTNVVAERCVLQVDLRSPELATLEEAETEIDRICANSVPA